MSSPSSPSADVLIVGAGPMGVAYAKVLTKLGHSFVTVTQSASSALEFEKETGVTAVIGGLDQWLSTKPVIPTHTIVAVSEQNLGSATLGLIKSGAKKILVEKPGAFFAEEVKEVAREAKLHHAEIFVGYNRRFYSSTQAARKMIQADGGVSSFHFEFTEWGHVIEKKVCPQSVKDEWFLHNSTHVVDLAFYLGGFPTQMTSYAAGSLAWHPRGSKYTGAGTTDQGALFSYHANWGAPGRWNLEVLTPKNRYIFKPVEKLAVQKLGTVAIEELPLEDALDKEFKPGIYRQTEAFLAGSSGILLGIEAQVAHLSFYEKMEKGLS